MIIDWLEYDKKEHVLAWFLLEAMAEAGMDDFGKFDSSKLNVELKVNGIEVPITGPMESLQKQLNSIEQKGIKLGRQEGLNIIKDKLEELFDESDNLCD